MKILSSLPLLKELGKETQEIDRAFTQDFPCRHLIIEIPHGSYLLIKHPRHGKYQFQALGDFDLKIEDSEWFDSVGGAGQYPATSPAPMGRRRVQWAGWPARHVPIFPKAKPTKGV